MINSSTLTADLQTLVRDLEDDLRVRADEVDEVREHVTAEWSAAVDAGRTAHDLETWREQLLTQVAVAWVLACVFVRFCEDNGLLPEPRLGGPGERGRRAANARMAHFADRPLDGDRAWLLHVFDEVRSLPGLGEVLGSRNPLRQFGPSDDAATRIVAFFTDVDVDTGELRRDFTDPAWDTRFLGDLYQDLSEHAKKTYALLQTPDFVESFILDRTLDPAVDEFGLDGFRMIDPACGSGHFLLGAFDRLFQAWKDRAPGDGDRANAARALESVFGIDLNPFAAAIARFRLLVAACRSAAVAALAEAPAFSIHVAIGDSLLHGPGPGQQRLDGIDRQDPATRHLYDTEDTDVIHEMLATRFHTVVANPPYITPRDPAANSAYRTRYETCHRQYSLSVPFMERLFDLAIRGAGDRPAGFVGQITANSFMKREFGKPLIEQFLAGAVDLTHVVDTSGAFIPGHGTPTVILFGRNRQPVGDTVRAVLGIRGEPERPSDPTKGVVWSSIVALIREPGAEDEYVSVENVARVRFRTHPWSLQGGVAPRLMERVQVQEAVPLGAGADVGFAGITGEDNALLVGAASTAVRRGLERFRPLVRGDQLRDHLQPEAEVAVWPYDEDVRIRPLNEIPVTGRVLWPYRRALQRRKRFGTPMEDLGLPWWGWREVYPDRISDSLTISFPFVATHNHFVLDRSERVFNRTAPVIKLEPTATEADHLDLLGKLNSSVACFWMKQVCQNKGNGGIGGGIGDEDWEPRFEFDVTKIKSFPVVEGPAFPWALALDELAQGVSASSPTLASTAGTPNEPRLSEARARGAELRRRMVAVQEELDWRCLYLYGVVDEDRSFPPDEVPGIDRGQRAFEFVLARRVSAGEVETEWFRRHGVTPQTDLPAEWPATYRERVEQRIALIESDRLVNLAERPEYKRRWNWEDWDRIEERAVRTWLLDRLEAPELWSSGQLRSVNQLADTLRSDPDVVAVAELWTGRSDVDLAGVIGDLVAEESVPYLAAHRYKEPGLRKRAAWERTWDLQRREDAGEDVGAIPVPPKYTSGDFRKTSYWRLRGKLDVPKERFVSHPGAERDGDGTAVLGWAGWDHLARARALAGWLEERRTNDGWEPERLIPLLAGVAELVPWVKQWHNDVDPALGERMGDFFAAYVDSEAHTLGIAATDLPSWRPPAPTRRRRTKR